MICVSGWLALMECVQLPRLPLVTRGELLHLAMIGPPPKGPEPQFADVIPNVTVAAGRDVTLPCVVDSLGDYKVAWIHMDRHILLTLHDRVITRNSRYRITHNNFRTWWLQILNVNESDSGHYMCQVNTSPMKNLVGIIQVVVPPRITENETSSDTDVREGSDVSLRCQASGSPNPQIKWRREDEKDITIGVKKVPTVEGQFLNITKVSRLHMAAYLCIASNGIPPAVSKRIMLNVNFAPMIWIPNQLVGAAVGADVTLDCNLESHPKSVTYWTRDGGGFMIISNTKYNSLLLDTGIYKVQMRLIIKNLRPDDFGSYTCVAKNSLGETEGTIRLYEIPKPHSSTYPSRGGLASSRAEGAHQATGEKMVRTWHKDGTEEGRMQDLANGDLEKRDSPSPVTVFAGSEKGEGQESRASDNFKPMWDILIILTTIVPVLIFCL
ncbi:Lachesin like protein [Argiope bruennichi]|uniref:Lachesin like protein n=1 Tax=Argiope bruennichi TaxID=94029 RepID=A0A8T0G4W7_ARGBR|nr:Lachesin like protein [Argiope bruennichi]